METYLASTGHLDTILLPLQIMPRRKYMYVMLTNYFIGKGLHWIMKLDTRESFYDFGST